ncbi:11844_t:CDS:1, partial [Funneliformis geosporum]
QKKQVVKYTKEQENNKAANHFNIDCSIVGRWVTASSNWNFEINEKSKKAVSG